jgi:hypothetical protein
MQKKKSQFTYELVKKTTNYEMKNFITALKNDTLRHISKITQVHIL